MRTPDTGTGTGTRTDRICTIVRSLTAVYERAENDDSIIAHSIMQESEAASDPAHAGCPA